MSTLYRLSFYVPAEALERVKEALFDAGAGKIGVYDRCCWQTPGQGQFRPLQGSDPHIGIKGQLEYLEEFKVEMVCAEQNLRKAVEELIRSHPYEVPAFEYYPVNQGLPCIR